LRQMFREKAPMFARDFSVVINIFTSHS
jgi:hypothetical protein